METDRVRNELMKISSSLESINKRLLQIEEDNRIFYYCLLRTQSYEVADEFRYRLETIERERREK